MSKAKKIVITVLLLMIIAVILTLYFVTASIYKSNFNTRYTTSIANSFSLEQFPHLSANRHEFVSDKGQKLIGYLYENEDVASTKGIVVFAHGMGAGGQNGYMDIFDYIARSGYSIFAYDATANDESEGDKVGGFPQGIIDLDYAVSFVKNLDEYKELPIILMGYSWGALSVANVVRYHPDVEGVVSLSGWSKSVDLLKSHGEEMVGKAVYAMIPFAGLYEYFTYGKYATGSGISAFGKSECKVMIVHSSDDTIVPIEYGYDLCHKKYHDDSRFVFKLYDNRGHDVWKNSNGETDGELLCEIVSFLDDCIH